MINKYIPSDYTLLFYAAGFAAGLGAWAPTWWVGLIVMAGAALFAAWLEWRVEVRVND